MLTEREKQFMAYWEQNRAKEKKVFRQLLVGLPLGLLFVVPVIVNFSSGWYKRANMWVRGHADDKTATVVIIAGLFILVFVAIFSKRHRWEMNEQSYRELESKEAAEKEIDDAAKDF
jgi:uncharacterized membrane protein